MIREAARASRSMHRHAARSRGPEDPHRGLSATARCMLEEGKPFALDTDARSESGHGRRSGRRLQGSAEGRDGRATRCCSTTGRSCSTSRASPARASTPACAWAASSPIARASTARAAASPRRRSRTRIARTSSSRPRRASTTSPCRSRATRRTSSRRARWCAQAGGQARIVAKIERQEAVENLAGIIDAADVVMVARGDLGVEMGYAELTGLQKTIIHESRTRNRVVITATQMMESMIQQPGADARRSERRGQRRDGRHRRGDALGRDRRRALSGQGGAGHGGGDRGRGEIPALARAHAASRRRAVLRHRRGDRDGRDVHGQSPEGARHRRADRIRRHAAVDVAHPRGYPDLRVHAPRSHAPPRHAVSRRVSGDLRRHDGRQSPSSCIARSSRGCSSSTWSTAAIWSSSPRASSRASKAAPIPCRS